MLFSPVAFMEALEAGVNLALLLIRSWWLVAMWPRKTGISSQAMTVRSMPAISARAPLSSCFSRILGDALELPISLRLDQIPSYSCMIPRTFIFDNNFAVLRFTSGRVSSRPIVIREFMSLRRVHTLGQRRFGLLGRWTRDPSISPIGSLQEFDSCPEPLNTGLAIFDNPL